MKTILQNFILTSSLPVQRLGPVQIYLGGVNLYQGPLPTIPGILKVPWELAKCSVLGFPPRMQREGHWEKGRGRRQGMDIGGIGDQSENDTARTG